MSLNTLSKRLIRSVRIIEHPKMQRFIVGLIVLNSILIGLETIPAVMNRFGAIIDVFDSAILALFVIEIVLKMILYRKKFFTDPWNLFDFFIVGMAIAPAAGSFSIFRTLRIVRTLRLLRSLPRLRLIIESLLQSVPSISWIVVLLGIVYYIFAVIGVNLFGAGYPEYFGDLGKSTFTLFQIMTLESWSSAIARPIMDGAPFAALYFVLFILIATYTTLNIFIAIVVNTMNEVSLKDLQEEEEHIKDFVHKENEQLHAKIDQLTKVIYEMKEKQQSSEDKELVTSWQ